MDRSRKTWTKPTLSRLKIAATAEGDVKGNDGCGQGKGENSFCEIGGRS